MPRKAWIMLKLPFRFTSSTRRQFSAARAVQAFADQDAGVVDQHVDRPGMPLHVGGGGRAGFGVGHVQRQGAAVALPGAGHQRQLALQQSFLVHVLLRRVQRMRGARRAPGGPAHAWASARGARGLAVRQLAGDAAAGDIAEGQRRAQRDARAGIVAAHDAAGVVAHRVQAVDGRAAGIGHAPSASTFRPAKVPMSPIMTLIA